MSWPRGTGRVAVPRTLIFAVRQSGIGCVERGSCWHRKQYCAESNTPGFSGSKSGCRDGLRRECLRGQTR